MEADNIIILWVLLWFMQVCKEWLCMFAVAFCEEAVDWNWKLISSNRLPSVAFCEEAVDWNWQPVAASVRLQTSLSARKLWIEIVIQTGRRRYTTSLSARKLWIEILLLTRQEKKKRSLSARKLWIEIPKDLNYRRCQSVAFCEEAVDWNTNCQQPFFLGFTSLSARKLWIEINQWSCALGCAWCRFLRGSCGLKFGAVGMGIIPDFRRFLRGSCGLKCHLFCCSH